MGWHILVASNIQDGTLSPRQRMPGAHWELSWGICPELLIHVAWASHSLWLGLKRECLGVNIKGKCGSYKAS